MAKPGFGRRASQHRTAISQPCRNPAKLSRVSGPMMERILLWLVPFIASVAVVKGGTGALPDIEASLTVGKQQYLVGEPIVLIFRVRNTGKLPVSLSESDPYGRCSSYRI